MYHVSSIIQQLMAINVQHSAIVDHTRCARLYWSTSHCLFRASPSAIIDSVGLRPQVPKILVIRPCPPPIASRIRLCLAIVVDLTTTLFV